MGYLAERQRDEKYDVRRRIDAVIRDISLRVRKQHAGGHSTPFWEVAAGPSEPSAGQTSYECDASLGSPAEDDCSEVQWDELGANEDTFSVGPGLTKILSSSTSPNLLCQNLPNSFVLKLTAPYRHLPLDHQRRYRGCIALAPSPCGT